MKSSFVAIGLGLIVVSSGSVASTDNFDRFYIGLGASFTELESESYDIVSEDKADVTSLGLVFGYQPIKYFAIEGRELFRVSRHDDLYDTQASLLARGILPIHEYFNFYAVAGLSLLAKDGFDEHGTDFTYGVGMRIKNRTPFILDVEYRMLYDDTFDGIDMELRSINLNFLYGF
ncbi:outer membrane beta-barrel protein [Vibrio furnissii]|uniref:outer membrane beta-barrel protein n=1 Tax=Vibrio furnissii TaxID=29494 RepID=UPI001558C2F4|nr:outer membrane beta-barrel protein [Vibrio furnissii]